MLLLFLSGDIKYNPMYGFKYFIKGKIFEFCKNVENVENVKGLI